MNLILGMPRSRTAWMSIALSSPKYNFQHEAFATHKCVDIEEYITKVYSDSTTMGRMLFENIDGFRELLGTSTVMVIYNDPEVVMKSWDSVLEKSGYDMTDEQREDHLSKLYNDQFFLNQVEDYAGEFMHMHATDVKMRWAVEKAYQFFNDGDSVNSDWLDKCYQMNIQRNDPIHSFDNDYLCRMFPN